MSDPRNGRPPGPAPGGPRGAGDRPIGEGEGGPEFELLPDDWDEQADELAAGFLSADEIPAADRELLARFCHLCLRYAHAEVRIQGEILCEIPAHLSVLRGLRSGDLLEEAAFLAAEERRNLELPDGPIEDLTEILDDRGIKVIEWPEAQGRRLGAFLFRPRTGPALLALAPPNSAAGRFILAHGYCHLVADVDPYEDRYCPHCAAPGLGPARRPGGRLLTGTDHDPFPADDLPLAELRADLFARALLLPAEHFAGALRGFGIRPGRGLDLARLEDVAYYYGVEGPVVLNRMADLRLLPIAEVLALAAEQQTLLARGAIAAPAAGDGPADAPPRAPHLPARFARLGLALFLRREVSLQQMATLLGIDRAAARAFVAASELQVSRAPTEAAPPGSGEL
ncbi:MAG: hypothetical protein FJY75_09190 [Candidatus Eisenbacteria bacterium]|uniref:ImmA/IrrE family metallo-endopeptidase n=1 Tax=Eiseniibacteriota bacterium TaxID=2212470 RepID=A0A937XCX1_UNCEI|nr:hypothetical protein [Candidatus Eisenbacteria bacterium]